MEVGIGVGVIVGVGWGVALGVGDIVGEGTLFSYVHDVTVINANTIAITIIYFFIVFISCFYRLLGLVYHIKIL